jgi:hypothetical protein
VSNFSRYEGHGQKADKITKGIANQSANPFKIR